jgi:hypothetical protein
MTEETDIETKAKEMGWSPKDDFRGNPDQWIDAETYVQRGETLMPLIKASNRRLTEELSTVKQELTKAKEQLTASQESIDALKEFNSAANRKAMKEAVSQTKAALIQAKRQGESEVEIELAEQLHKEQEALQEAEEESSKKGNQPEKRPNGADGGEDFTKSAEWRQWTEDNPWFGKDKRRTALSMGIADELRLDPETSGLKGKAFLDKVTEEVEKIFSPGAPSSKVESGGRGSGGGTSGQSYSDLPADAKEACESQARRLVGADRAFKTKEDWRKHYTKTYFEGT